MKNIADNLQTLQKQEAEFARTHKSDTDDDLSLSCKMFKRDWQMSEERGNYRAHLLEAKAWSL